MVRVGWPRTRSSDQSERCTKETSTCDKIEKILPQRWRPCKEHRKSIDELKKVTSCNRCGAIGHWEEDCTQPARSRKKRSPSVKGKGKSRRFRREKSDGKGRGGSSNCPIVEVYNDGSKNSNVTYEGSSWLCGSGLCGAAKSLCGAKLVALMAQTCAREASATLRQSMRVFISEESEIRLSVYS